MEKHSVRVCFEESWWKFDYKNEQQRKFLKTYLFKNKINMEKNLAKMGQLRKHVYNCCVFPFLFVPFRVRALRCNV